MNNTCERYFEPPVGAACRDCPLAGYCSQEGFLPGELVVAAGAEDPDLELVLKFAAEQGLEVREIPGSNPRTFILS